MDNNIDEQELQKQKEQEASTKTAHVAGKAAATYFGGGVGGKIYDAASNTEVGKRIEQAAGSALQQNPLLNKASQKLNDSGALDAADKGLDMASGDLGGKGLSDGTPTGGLPNTNGLQDNANPLANNKSNLDNTNSFDNNLENNDSSLNGTGLGDFQIFKLNNIQKISLASGVVVFLIIAMLVIGVMGYVMTPIKTASNYTEGIWAGIVDFFTKDQQELEEDFYKELKRQQKNHNTGSNPVCIDINLITSTLTIYRQFDKVLIEGNEPNDMENNEGDEEVYSTKMIRRIAELAKYQKKDGKLSIGDFNTRKSSNYYQKLIGLNGFIASYYKEYLPTDSVSKEKKIIEIADDIYLLYKQVGPSQSCGGNYGGPSMLCPNGVTIEGEGTFDLEEYIAGVVSNEAYSNEGMEALKAQAVAARTYALLYTNYCTKTIPNSTSAQTFTRNINDNSREAATSTRGEILIDQNGNIFSAQYDSFCFDDKDCPDSKKNEDGTYSVTYTRLPGEEKHTIVLSDPKQYDRIVPGHGHARGMSQLVSYQLAKEGKTYEEILKYFYSDGIEISQVLSPNTTEGSKIITSAIGNYVNINDINQYIFDNVNKAGVGTRAGVVAAATSLISGIHAESGYILPYELYPSGKYSGYGLDPNWGTNTGRSDYPLNGLDCSGFISWAIHNGGYNYVVKNAKSWGIAGRSRAWSKGKYDDSAIPGDLIYNAPASANGTSGHIRMIIAVTNDSYTIAEASSGKNGVRIKNISFTSEGNYYLVDMTSYYDSASKVSDYPG